MGNKLTLKKNLTHPPKKIQTPKKYFNLIKTGKQLSYNNTKQVNHPNPKNEPDIKLN